MTRRNLGAQARRQLVERRFMLLGGDRAGGAIGVELSLLVAVDRGCRLTLLRRFVLCARAPAQQRPQQRRERDRDEGERSKPEQRDGRNRWLCRSRGIAGRFLGGQASA
jgi:hypothetical protein